MDIDDATLKACQRGEPRALRRLVEAYQQPVYSLCVALAGSDGEDLAQETFMRVVGAIRRFDSGRPTDLRVWILCIARRLCADRARHRALRVEITPADPDGIDAPDPAPDPEESFAAARLEAKVLAALAALPVEQRAAIALYEWEGLAYEEIAVIEDVPVGTVRSRLARARTALRAAAAGERGHEEDEHVHREESWRVTGR
jgi:RNA polymerase sigma-70 factor (ECF subfamily)